MAGSIAAPYPLSTSTSIPADLHANTRWAHFTSGFVDTGELATISDTALRVWEVLKVRTNFKDGLCRLSEEEIARLTRKHLKSVSRAIRELRQRGRVDITKERRKNVYRLYEKIPIKDATGAIVGMATWAYVPDDMEHAMKELKQALLTGDTTHLKYVHIEIYGGTEPPPPEAPSAPASEADLVSQTLQEKDPELYEIMSKVVGAHTRAVEAQCVATGNSKVTYPVGNSPVTYPSEQGTARLPITGEQVTAALPPLDLSKREKREEEHTPGSLLPVGKGEGGGLAHASTRMSVEKELRRLLGGYPG